MKRRWARLRAFDQNGFTIVELMVASFMASIVLFAALSVLENVTKNERGQTVRHTAMLEIRQAMTRITKDIRQATWVDPLSDHDTLTIQTIISGSTASVTYQLVSTGTDIYELRRTVDGNTQAIITNMVLGTTPLGTPDPPICYSYYSAGMPSECLDPAPPDDHPPEELTAIRITLAKDPEHNPGTPITLATDVQLRNI